MKNNWILDTSVPFFALALLLFAGCKSKESAIEESSVRADTNSVTITPGSPPATALSIEVARPAGSSTLSLNARLVWDENVTARLFTPFAGRVSKIDVETGSAIKAGDALAEIASPDYGQAQADAGRSAADLALAQKTATRIHELFSHGAAAEKDLIAADADLERAKLEQRRTAERLRLYGGTETAIDQAYVLRSPINGTVVEKNINPGSELRSDQMLANTPQLASPLFVVTDPTRLWIQIDVPERDHARLHPGQTFTLRSFSLPGLSFTGRVDFVSDSLDPLTRTIKMRGSVPNPGRALKAEMFVKAEFAIPAEQGTEIPVRAAYLRGDNHYVVVEDSPGHYVRREITLGADHGDTVVVNAGLKAGERVVVNGVMLLEQLLAQGPN